MCAAVADANRGAMFSKMFLPLNARGGTNGSKRTLSRPDPTSRTMKCREESSFARWAILEKEKGKLCSETDDERTN